MMKHIKSFGQSFLINRVIGGMVVITIITSVLSQLYTLSIGKAFWLDEWFLLYNIKFRTYAGLFSNLDYIQQIPRVYLALLKYCAETFNYSYYSLRAIPTLVQGANIYLICFFVSKILFREGGYKRYLFITLFISYHSSLFYFSQFKQYSMEMFITILCFLSFNYFSKPNKLRRSLGITWILTGILFITGPLLSYSFPIVAAPVILFLSLAIILQEIDFKTRLRYSLLISAFVIGLSLSWFTDLRFVLFDKSQYGNFSENIMNYSSLTGWENALHSFIWLLTSIFFFDRSYPLIGMILLYLLKALTFTLVSCGIVVEVRRLFFNKRLLAWLRTLSMNNSPSSGTYFLGILMATLTLFAIKILPVGAHRLTYYCVLPLAYFFVIGLAEVLNYKTKFNISLIPCALFIGLFPALRSSLNEFKNENLNFDQRIYNNVGEAIKLARMENLPIVVRKNTFYPESIMEEQEILIIKAHHLYKPRDSLKVVQLNDSSNNLHPFKKEILLHKFSFDAIE